MLVQYCCSFSSLKLLYFCDLIFSTLGSIFSFLSYLYLELCRHTQHFSQTPVERHPCLPSPCHERQRRPPPPTSVVLFVETVAAACPVPTGTATSRWKVTCSSPHLGVCVGSHLLGPGDRAGHPLCHPRF